MRQLQPDIWGNFFARARVGDVLRGKVSRMASFGAFVELEEGIEGLCHLSEVDEDHAGSGPGRLEVGREFSFKVIRLNPGEKKIGLSMKNVEQEPTVAASAEGSTPTTAVSGEAESSSRPPEASPSEVPEAGADS